MATSNIQRENAQLKEHLAGLADVEAKKAAAEEEAAKLHAHVKELESDLAAQALP
jgi:hypothetical protein